MSEYKVDSDKKVNLKNWDPNDADHFKGGKEKGEKQLKEYVNELVVLQELLFAEHKQKLLIILQAMDTGGKDGTIKAVLKELSPSGVRVVGFKVPTQEELDHDYLWRVHKEVPGKGEVVVFNRSHYEDLLTVRVHKLVPKEIWEKRFDQIKNFELMLAEEGTTILKFFLHISKDEQKKRLQERLDDPQKRWKFNPRDLKERKLWADYMQAYEDVLSKTSTSQAPWHIIPANKNWYRNLLVAKIIVDKLKELNMKYPRIKENLDNLKID